MYIFVKNGLLCNIVIVEEIFSYLRFSMCKDFRKSKTLEVNYKI